MMHACGILNLVEFSLKLRGDVKCAHAAAFCNRSSIFLSKSLATSSASRFTYGAKKLAILSYDWMASFLAPYENRDALEVARDLDKKIEDLLREAAA